MGTFIKSISFQNFYNYYGSYEDNTYVFKEGINIINADSSKLAGPTQDQIIARQKLMSGQQIPDAEKALATTITPMEQAERNKSYAMYTSAILQKLYKKCVYYTHQIGI